MDSERVIAVRSPHLARPGRRAIVVVDLADLQGPRTGTVELPLRLFWYPNRVFDLRSAEEAAEMYETILREASKPADLTCYLDRETLLRLWPALRLPSGVRQAWQELHPVLRDGAMSVA